MFYQMLIDSIRTDRLAEYELIESVKEYFELYSSFNYVTEREKKTLATRVKTFIDRIIAAMVKFAEDLRINIKKAIANKQVKRNLKKTKASLEKYKKEGATKVTTMDVIKYKQTYMECYKKLWKLAKRFDKVEYSSVEAIDGDLANFNGMYEKYTKELDTIANTKIEKDIDDIIKFCEYELNGTSAVFKTINDTEKNLQEMKASADNLAKKREILGDEVIPKRLNIIQKVVMKISTFVKDCITKFIVAIIMVFG